MLTPSGRFEINKKICLSITGFHPEHWQPSWGVRTAILAIISFFPTKSEGAIGGLDWTKEERISLAQKSVDYSCSSCGIRHSNVLLLGSSSADENKAKKFKDDIDISKFKLTYEKTRGNSEADASIGPNIQQQSNSVSRNTETSLISRYPTRAKEQEEEKTPNMETNKKKQISGKRATRYQRTVDALFALVMSALTFLVISKILIFFHA
jgi:ubiquitin-conjugating enzyme E2 J1